ncbi:DUF2628 domain-containing protein [Deinococcus sp. Arct2-2]|uniref:SHOCT domain-containing protein n=1 Tax=Deinococcus sp. Arct2-2 TaxID=2568653 RepID=UPI0010A3A9FD|nr:SHOCT domain-containing protein [Deinococcus sp. Arct2-2]THF70718.1 DUF2628 domain-containing protein [Deinococcus sp. Arct2-2]
MTLPASYEETFRRFDREGGRWLATWNWAAFVFGVFWYLYRGVWVKALIYFAVIFIVSAITGGIATIPLWIVVGVLANYDLYLLKRKGTQLWDGGGVAPNAVPGVTSPAFSAPSPSSAMARLTALDNARTQGVISDAEYADKRQQLELDAERERKLGALEDMRRAGILSPVEYEAKKRDIMFESYQTAAPQPAGISLNK